jgi:hypothetical protein
MIAGNGQSLFDISIQEYGDISAVFDLVTSNKNITAIDRDVKPGDKLNIDPTLIVNNDVVNFYRLNNIKPATGMIHGGIGYMSIGTDFKVS